MSLAVNLVLVTQLVPLLPYYGAYWNTRAWISQKVLRRPHPDPGAIYQSDEFTLRPSPRPTPRFYLRGILDSENPRQQQTELRKATLKAFGLARIPRGDLGFATHSSELLAGFVRHKVSYQTQTGVRIPAYLLAPRDLPPPTAAVLIVHGCGFGKAGPAGLIDDIHNSLGVDLVKAGFLVLIPDRRGFGELQPVPRFLTPSCGTGLRDGRPLLSADALAAFDTNLRSLDVFDLLVAVDYLASLPEIKAVGVAGLSGGGVIAGFLGGLSDNITAVVLANSIVYDRDILSTFDNGTGLEIDKSFVGVPGSPLEFITADSFLVEPSALTSLVDSRNLTLFALLPPLPVLLEFGANDPLTYLRGGEDAIELMRNVYARHGAQELVSSAVVQAKHEFIAGPIVEFFLEHLYGE